MMCDSIPQIPQHVKTLASENVAQTRVLEFVKLGMQSVNLSAHAMLLVMKTEIAVLMLLQLAVNVSLCIHTVIMFVLAVCSCECPQINLVTMM